MKKAATARKASTTKAATARKASTTKAAPRTAKLCKNGLHPMIASNRYTHPSKGTMCRACIRDYMRDYMRERRAELEAKKKPKSRARKG
jgi:hypothetical protein